jgi:hypothetical protein
MAAISEWRRSIGGVSALLARWGRDATGGPRFALYSVCAAGILASGFALLMPPFQANDEHGHFVRAFQISRGHFVEHEGERLPSTLLAAIHRYGEGRLVHRYPGGRTFERFRGQTILRDAMSPGSKSDTWEQPSGTRDNEYFMSLLSKLAG